MTSLAILRRFWWAVPLALALAWGLRVDHLRATYKARWQAVSTEYAAFKVAIIDKTAAALAKEKEQADAADKAHQSELADVRAAADRYIAAHRVRVVKAAGGGSPSPAPADPGVPEGLPADSLVAVSDSDVHACSVAVKYAVDAHDWAVSQ